MWPFRTTINTFDFRCCRTARPTNYFWMNITRPQLTKLAPWDFLSQNIKQNLHNHHQERSYISAVKLLQWFMTCFHENIPPWFAFCNKLRHQMKWCNCCCNLLQMIKLNFPPKKTFGNNYFHLTWNPTSTLVTSLLIAALWNTMQKYFSPSWRPAATPGYQTGHPSLYALAVPQYYVPEDNKQNWWQRKMHKILAYIS